MEPDAASGSTSRDRSRRPKKMRLSPSSSTALFGSVLVFRTFGLVIVRCTYLDGMVWYSVCCAPNWRFRNRSSYLIA